MTARSNTEDFIKKATAIHGSNCIYDKTVYETSNKNVLIKCVIHNKYFSQMPSRHLSGIGCQDCGLEKGLKIKKDNYLYRDTEWFILEAVKIHGDLYIYDKTIYEERLKIVLIKCKIHDKYFEQTPYVHLIGHGCHDCGREKIRKARQKDTNWFIIEAKKIHGDYYNYNKSLYENCEKHLIITCPIHGDFLQIPNNHINMKQGCRECGYIKSFDREFKSVYSEQEIDDLLFNKNIKRLSKYTFTNKKIDLKCIICSHEWSPRCSAVIGKADQGCPVCNKRMWSSEDVDNHLIENNIKIKRIGEFKNINDKISWQCLKCNDMLEIRVANVVCPSVMAGCSNCNRNKNEGFVRDFLRKNNLKSEKLKIKLPISKGFAKPDFYIASMNLIIEYNGGQHYKLVRLNGMSLEKAEENFKYQVVRDQQLRDYCGENDINLLEIDGRKYKNGKLINFLYNYFKINNE